ncbi:MAG: bifunctional 4-hydroxy-2-oxoglutarate aldolase/2-dehydro-3-deoxy-phosphogluconate aldolase [Anaerolineae bacterium]|nr:bifunctional 4-hydroxy-2-oxoglutarate aldolase/2-dehydro-3-deoxy-phosphogluconate aldolase [Anaerolineae bacterium]MCB9461074.1 bifunctional 4-hydroxy-2-oxoglutarate aldolase/2-dehydro-3-deoxy-phosphogluconate aldolase [Anaerolineaceae bacterium]
MARFTRLQVYNQVLNDKVVPLFYHKDIDIALKVTGALYKGGSRLLEFTNRGDFAINVFSQLVQKAADEFPEMIIGAGTVSDAPTAALYLANGANFIVSPTFNPEVARLCNSRKVAYMPGCATLTEIATAEEYGAEVVKLFPGETSGGPAFVKAVKGPRPWTSIMPTGGVSADEDNLREWFSAGVACVGMGSKLVRSDYLKAQDYDSITETVKQAFAIIKKVTS